MSGVNLRVDWCSYEAAKYAVEKWHYSGSMPAGKTVKIGAWEGSVFIGCVIYARGSNKHIGKPFELNQTEAIELVRVALSNHNAHTSHIVTLATKLIAKHNPGLRIIISFADPNEGHAGIIYQAMNWVYTGHGSSDSRCTRYNKGGKVFHWRTVAGALSKRGLRSTIEDARVIGYNQVDTMPKHRYLYPLDRAMRRQILPLAKPYPKSCGQSVEGDTSTPQVEDAGSTPAVRSIEVQHAQ